MVNQLEKTVGTDIFYPVSDGEPVAETFDHLYVMITTLMVLRHYLAKQRATVLANQFLYYAEGFPTARVAPDVMVIFNVEPGGRDSYKVWEEGEAPSVIFEMTSKGTEAKDRNFKKDLYEQLGVAEYWLYDPKGEWIPEQLRGYRLHRGVYEPITDGRSEPLQLRVELEGKIIAFYREDTGERLLIPDELLEQLRQETQQRRQAEERAEAAESARRQAVPQMLEVGLTVEQIAKMLGLSLEDVRAIANK